VSSSLAMPCSYRLSNQSNRMPLDVTKDCLVAFIDIMGFGSEIESARTNEELQRAYAKVRLVQREFQKPSASDRPEEQSRFNLDEGRRVIALSDAVVVVISPDRRALASFGRYDLFGLAIYQLLLAQARCLVSHGIFVRGGVSHGPFYFEDDILLSPALVRAYELESKCAEYPPIVIPESTRETIIRDPTSSGYGSEEELNLGYFAKDGRKRWRGEQLYFLDYVRVMVEVEHRGWLPQDHKDYLDAKKRRDYKTAEAIRYRRDLKDAAYFLEGHRMSLENAYRATESEHIRKKYRWLMRYHNASFRRDLDYLRDQVIDLLQFQARGK
jgi:hypothetical protein